MKYACDVTFKKEETSFNRNQLLPVFDLMTEEKRVEGILTLLTEENARWIAKMVILKNHLQYSINNN